MKLKDENDQQKVQFTKTKRSRGALILHLNKTEDKEQEKAQSTL